jgi:quinol-cytochrome oxidoreductase complex cytochrome b subunit
MIRSNKTPALPDQPESHGRTGSFMTTVSNLILHLHPSRVPAKAIRFSHTFGLGGMAALLIALQLFTGILLKFQYIPFVEQAYWSVVAIKEDLIFGQLILNIHHWSAQLLIVITFLHLARTVFTTAYFPPRRSNWLIGLGLFLSVILMNFTGYLLPWDQLSYWAITVASSLLDYIPLLGGEIKFQVLGGSQVGQATLLNFYHYHTGILPVVLVILMAYHFWKVRKAKGVILPEVVTQEEKREMVPVIPELVRKELVTGLLLLAFVFVLSLLANAPLLEKANPTDSPNPAKAPWYFMGIQELIVHVHPFLSAFVIPFLLLIAFILIPYSRKDPVNTGKWFSSPATRRKLVMSFVFTLLLTIAWVVAGEFLPALSELMPGLPVWISEGIIPFFLFTGIVFLAGWFILDRFRIAYNELIMCGFVFIATAYLVLMVTGIFFRGAGMELTLFK